MSANENTTNYYDVTASRYDEMHGEEQNYEHTRALELLVPTHFPTVNSVLDVGTGTGRTLQWLDSYYRKAGAVAELTGIEPSTQLADIARDKLPNANIVIGSGERLPFPDDSFDLVTIAGVLHHVADPKQVLKEMFRVSRSGVLISDHNNFSFGSDVARKVRLALYSVNLLGAFSFVKQGFRKQGYSEGDGWWYPYSVLNDFDVISDLSESFAIVPTRRPNSPSQNFITRHSHLAIACSKRRQT